MAGIIDDITSGIGAGISSVLQPILDPTTSNPPSTPTPPSATTQTPPPTTPTTTQGPSTPTPTTPTTEQPPPPTTPTARPVTSPTPTPTPTPQPDPETTTTPPNETPQTTATTPNGTSRTTTPRTNGGPAPTTQTAGAQNGAGPTTSVTSFGPVPTPTTVQPTDPSIRTNPPNSGTTGTGAGGLGGTDGSTQQTSRRGTASRISGVTDSADGEDGSGVLGGTSRGTITENDTSPALLGETSASSRRTASPTTTSFRTLVSTESDGDVVTTVETWTDGVLQTGSADSRSGPGSSTGFFAKTGAVAAVFTVVGLVLIALLALLVFLLRRRRRRRVADQSSAFFAGSGPGAYGNAKSRHTFIDGEDDDEVDPRTPASRMSQLVSPPVSQSGSYDYHPAPPFLDTSHQPSHPAYPYDSYSDDSPYVMATAPPTSGSSTLPYMASAHNPVPTEQQQSQPLRTSSIAPSESTSTMHALIADQPAILQRPILNHRPSSEAFEQLEPDSPPPAASDTGLLTSHLQRPGYQTAHDRLHARSFDSDTSRNLGPLQVKNQP